MTMSISNPDPGAKTASTNRAALALSVRDLHKQFSSNQVAALSGLSLDIPAGSFVSLIGPNGAGKSTLINIICTLLPKCRGQVLIDGRDIEADADWVREQIGIVFQESVLDPDLTVYENLFLRARLYRLSRQEADQRIVRLCEDVAISDLLQRPYRQLSGGQRRRVDIARGLINYPRLLILDEPTTGLDPNTRRLVWETIKQLQTRHQIAVLLTTHYMEETLGSDQVFVIDGGRIVAQGTPDSLRANHSRFKLHLTAEPEQQQELLSRLRAQELTFSAQSQGILVETANCHDALDIVDNLRGVIAEFECIKGSMDDVYMSILGRPISEGVAECQ